MKSWMDLELRLRTLLDLVESSHFLLDPGSGLILHCLKGRTLQLSIDNLSLKTWSYLLTRFKFSKYGAFFKISSSIGPVYVVTGTQFQYDKVTFNRGGVVVYSQCPCL